MVGPLLGLWCRGGRAQSGVQLGQRAVSPLAVLFKCLRLHYLATMAAHHQVKVIMARVEAKDGHVWEERGQEMGQEIGDTYESNGSNIAMTLSGAGRDDCCMMERG